VCSIGSTDALRLLRLADGQVGSPAERDWLACAKCHAAIEADDREALLDRASLIPVPRTVPERFAPKFLERARRLHLEFWETRSGPARPS
jgi:hypothetical protein